MTVHEQIIAWEREDKRNKKRIADLNDVIKDLMHRNDMLKTSSLTTEAELISCEKDVSDMMGKNERLDAIIKTFQDDSVVRTSHIKHLEAKVATLKSLVEEVIEYVEYGSFRDVYFDKQDWLDKSREVLS